jgi:hypothetical protein
LLLLAELLRLYLFFDLLTLSGNGLFRGCNRLFWGLVEVENEKFHILRGESLTNVADNIFRGLPLWGLEVVKDHTRVAVLFLNACLDHLDNQFLRKVLVVVRVDFRFFLSLGGWLLALGFLGLFLLFKGDLKLFLSLLQEFGCLIGNWKSTLDAVVIELVKFHDATLVLLREEVGNRSLASLFRSIKNDVELIFVLDSGRHLSFSLFMLLFSNLSLNRSLGFNSGGLAFGEPFGLFGLGLFLGELSELIFSFLELLAELLKSLLLLILLSQLRPELHAWHPQSQEERIDGRWSLSWGSRWVLRRRELELIKSL